MSNWKQAANDKRTHHIYAVTTSRTRSDPRDVPEIRLIAEIARGYDYFMGKRPGLHRETFRYEFSDRSATA